MAHVSLHVDKTQSLADVETYDDDVRVQGTPVLWVGCVIKVEAIRIIAELRLKDVWLVGAA